MNNDLIAWHEWQDKSFELAKNSNKPIFLFIGHIGCYWCEQMHTQSFLDEQIAIDLKEKFISIHVDANERPDIGRYYHKVFTQMTGREANYPICVFMTHDKIPFYSTSYIPRFRSDGMMGLDETLDMVSGKYAKERDALEGKGREILAVMQEQKSSIEATKINTDLITLASGQIKELFDEKNGGFGDKPKFPRHSVLNLIVDIYTKTKDVDLLNILQKSLDAMIDGALYDSQNAGFLNYCMDAEWEKAYEVKSLSNNALLIEVLQRAYELTGDDKYRHYLQGTLGYIDKEFVKDSLYITSNLADSRDESIITATNAMMISSLFCASGTDKSYITIAEDSLQNLISLMMPQKILYHAVTNDGVNIEAFLDDYAYLANALLKAAELTKKESYLIQASSVINEAIRRFFVGGRWRYSEGELSTFDDVFDRDYPSATSKMVIVLKEASRVINPEYEKFALRTLEINSYMLMRQPISMPELCRGAIC